mgnify:FL=1
MMPLKINQNYGTKIQFGKNKDRSAASKAELEENWPRIIDGKSADNFEILHGR